MTQETALAILKTGANVFLTGEPGSGKTYMVNAYVRYLRARGIYPAITASTGIAATHLNGVTIHSWSGIGIRGTLTQQDLDRLADNDRLKKRILDTHVLIIDEISMLEAGTLDSVDQVCRTIRNIPEPFGGMQIVLVGDFFQLPPISKSHESKPKFAFAADCWPEAKFAVCYLTEQHRQSDAKLSSVLAGIRSGLIAKETTEHLASRRFENHDDVDTVTKLLTHNSDVDRLNTDQLSRLDDDVHIFTMTSQGPDALVDQLVHGCLSPETLELKLDAAVMCTRNNPEVGFVNGTLGTIVDFDPDTGYPIIKTRQGDILTIEPMDWSIEDGEKIQAKIVQIPLRLAWAITVHKSQGMSLDAAILDLTKSFDYGQGYVALSRVRTLDGLFLLGWNDRALRTDPAIQVFDLTLREQSTVTERAWQAQSDRAAQKQQQAFLEACGGTIRATTRRQAATTQEGRQSETHAERLVRIREKYPQAYRSWSSADDERLAQLYQADTKVKKLSEQFERQPGAIRSRLKHLGLV